MNELPVEKMIRFYRSGFGRPSKEMYSAMGSVILQQMHDLTDEETVRQLAFNSEWHYALDIVGESDEAKYMSLKTLWNFRAIMVRQELDREIFDVIADKLAKVFRVNLEKQRLDSVHIRSNMKRLGRINIFARSMHCFLRNLKRHHGEEFGLIPAELAERYLSEKALGCFSMVKPTESEKTLKRVSRDLYELTELFSGNDKIKGMTSYKVMARVLGEQCTVTESPGPAAVEVKVKPAKEIASDSLQNPSDVDASYDGHKGQGYQVQVMEAYSRGEDGGKGLNLITHVSVERAHESDANALIPALESAKERDLVPKEVLADSLYGGDENTEKAKEMGVEVVSPVMGRKRDDEKELSVIDFEKNAEGEIIRCPLGKEPKKARHEGERHTVIFSWESCSGCPLAGQCPVKKGKRGNYLHYEDKQIRLLERRMLEETAEFRDRYRYRAGVEGTMSAFDRLTGVKRLRVRGLYAVRFCAVLKAVGLNIFRAAAYRKGEMPVKTDGKCSTFFVFKIIMGLKGFRNAIISHFVKFIDLWREKPEYALQNAA